MRNIQVDLPEALITKLRVLRMLTSRDPSDIVPMLEELVNHKIGELLGLSTSRVTPVKVSSKIVDETPKDNLSDGLGDDVDDADVAEALKEMENAVTDQDIEDDLDVSEPDKEAKAVASKGRNAMSYLTEPSAPAKKRRGARVSLLNENDAEI
jgi:hypothetical protein